MEDFIVAFLQGHLGGTLTFILVSLCIIIEKSKIQFNPIGWIGCRLNKGMNDKLDIMDGKFSKLENDFSNHMIESWRRDILNFSCDLMMGNKKTKENFDYILKIHDKYAKYIEENDLENGQVDLAYEFISSRYQYCTEHNCFL